MIQLKASVRHILISMFLISSEKYLIKNAKNKINKWTKVIEEDQVIKCRSKKDFKSIKIFQMCAWDDYTNEHGHSVSCDLTNPFVYDESMFIGRIQINLNDGQKRKYLYFQADYKVKQSDGG